MGSQFLLAVIVQWDLLSKTPQNLIDFWDVSIWARWQNACMTIHHCREGKGSINSKQNKVWTVSRDLIHKQREDSRVIIDAIYSAYGHVSVTTK